ncbi:protein kinase domain-containing protein [Fusobacterium varium]|uniref:protein kinase domain-containing protein n=1 Tax=Fusobacterium varium TaxID=856 RepID=UPI00242F6C86|nr:protein kinase [Fusobacterium varium]
MDCYKTDCDIAAKAIQRFENEIIVTEKLKDIEGIIKIKDYNLEKMWYVMPFLQETDTLFEKQTDLNIKINFLIKLGRIILKVHKRGFAHRDIKPGNLLLNEGEIVLTDFGIVWEIDQKSITKENEKIGPYSFMAPEMFSYVNEKRELRPADIFSFAQVAYCMVYCKKYGSGTTLIREEFEDKEEDIVMEPFFQFLEGATQINPAKRLKMEKCLCLLNEFFKILVCDDETIKKWKIKKIEREIITEYEPDGKTYYELIKISLIIKKLSKNYKFSINDNKSIGTVHDCIILDEGIRIVYKTVNQERSLLCFPKKLEIKENPNNNLSYFLKINKKNIEYGKYDKYDEYSENININIFENNQNQNFLLNKDTILYFFIYED